MEKQDDALKQLMGQNLETPSMGFTNQTMAAIQERVAAKKKEARTSIFLLVAVLGFLLGCAVWSLGLQPKFEGTYGLELPGMDMSLGVALLCLMCGIWMFILRERKRLV